MRKRINDHNINTSSFKDQNINTSSFKEDVEFSADTPHSVQIKHFSCDEIVPLHYAETLEMLVADHVDGTVTVGKNRRKLLEQDVIIIPPYYVHSTVCHRSDGTLYNLKISFENMKTFMDIQAMAAWMDGSLFGVLFVPELFEPMKKIIQRLIEEDNNLFSRMHCILDAAELLTSANQKSSLKELHVEPGDEDRLRQLIQWTHEHYQEHVSLDMVSQQMNISKFYLCKYFKQTTNMTYLTYLNLVRLEKAVQRLRLGKNVTECAAECGFDSVSYFVQLFKRTLGCTPGQYTRLNGNESSK